jgi:hypothetical protein
MFGESDRLNALRIDPKTRTASLDFDALMGQVDLAARGRSDARADMARLGVLMPAEPYGIETPRDSVVPPEMPYMMEPGIEAGPGFNGLGNIHTQLTRPGERYWERWTTGRARPGEKPIAKRPEPYLKCNVPIPPELEKYRASIEACIIPMWQRLNHEFILKLKEKLVCGTYFMQPVTHLAPPVTAICIDLFTDAAGVTVSRAGVAPPATVLSIDVPDRFIVVIDRFANRVLPPAVNGDAQWSIQRNRAPIRCYGDFDQSLGIFTDPTKFGSPIILKHKDEFRLLAQSNAAGDVQAEARAIGWAFAVKSISQDGSYNEFHTH